MSRLLRSAGSFDEGHGEQWNPRWIMVHMIEEHARHCDYADQSLDGVTG
ncbi:MAG: mycothiol transferase [Acidimicrobiales bacterium]